jgi:hypothetical protein
MHQYTPSKPVYCVVATDLLNDSYGQYVYNNNSERDVVLETESPGLFSLLTVYVRPYIFSLSDNRFTVVYNDYKDRSQGASPMTG